MERLYGHVIFPTKEIVRDDDTIFLFYKESICPEKRKIELEKKANVMFFRAEYEREIEAIIYGMGNKPLGVQINAWRQRHLGIERLWINYLDVWVNRKFLHD